MERWRKNLAMKNVQHASNVSSNSARHTAKEETTWLLKLRRPVNGESSNRGSMWKPTIPSSRKSIPRRLSYSKHDDSISLMNIGNNLDDTMKSTPMKPETVPEKKISNLNETKKRAIEDDDDEELGVKKDTLEYLKSIGIIGSTNSQQEGKASTVPTKKLSSTKNSKILLSAKKAVQTNVYTSKESLGQSDQGKENIQKANVKELQNNANLISLQLKVKELLIKQTKEKSKLRERYEKEIKDLEKSHEEELIGLFKTSAKANTLEPPVLTITSISMSENNNSQELNVSQDSFLNSPFSGTWQVSHHDDNVFLNDSPTLGFNSTCNITTNGQQYLDTPATRRLVTQRITQGIETLFFP